MVATLTKLNRRDFLRSGLVFGAGAAGLAAGYAAVPDVFARAVYAGKQGGVVNDKVLVMIQLAGGNDGRTGSATDAFVAEGAGTPALSAPRGGGLK